MAPDVEATYRVVTPLFCAGADPLHADAELRPASFKGVLRFWWRALAWSRLHGDLKAIRKQEDGIFGSAGGGQSRVSLSLIPTSEPTQVKAGAVLRIGGGVVGGARYLGYGVMEAFASRNRETVAGQLIRPCLRAPFEFAVRMRVRDLAAEQMKHLRDALIALGVLGGLGSRSRKGYGSLALQSLRVEGEDRWQAPRSAHKLRARIAALRVVDQKEGWPEFTALSPQTRHVLAHAEARDLRAPLALLDLIGREMMRYRSWGHNGRVLGDDSERNFRDDHDLMEQGSRRHAHPRRIAFGLPHNYGKKQSDQVGPYDRDLDRRASPLFIHLHECGGTPVAVLSLLPARFLPERRSAISVGGRRVSQKPEAELYRPVHAFLDRLCDPKQCKEPLRAEEVTP